MKWKLKSTAFRILSEIPFGRDIYGLIQRHITRSIVPNPDRIRQKMEVALVYWKWLVDNGEQAQMMGGQHLDFGAGWHPTIPMALYAWGMNTQFLIDLAPAMDAVCIAATFPIFKNVCPAVAEKAGLPFVRAAGSSSGKTVQELLGPMGIEYRAPYGELRNVADGTANLVTATQVLLHIDRPILLQCLKDIHQALKPGGIFMATIHLHPLYGGLDTSGNSFRHLIYSDEEWNSFGSEMMSYTRLKAPDYQELLLDAGFEVRGLDITKGSREDYEALSQIAIHPCFAKYSRDDLAARHLFVVAQKRNQTGR